MLGIFGVHLNDREIADARCQSLDYNSQDRSGATDARSIRLSRGRNDRLTVLLVDPLHNGNLLGPAGEKSAVADFFNADDGRIVLKQHRDREEIGHVINNNADRSRLARTQI